MKGAFLRQCVLSRKTRHGGLFPESSGLASGRALLPGRPGPPGCAFRNRRLARVMQKFLSNLLIFFALGLCALCAFQWVRESRLRREIAELQHTVYLKLDAIQNLEASLKQTKE